MTDDYILPQVIEKHVPHCLCGSTGEATCAAGKMTRTTIPSWQQQLQLHCLSVLSLSAVSVSTVIIRTYGLQTSPLREIQITNHPKDDDYRR